MSLDLAREWGRGRFVRDTGQLAINAARSAALTMVTPGLQRVMLIQAAIRVETHEGLRARRPTELRTASKKLIRKIRFIATLVKHGQHIQNVKYSKAKACGNDHMVKAFTAHDLNTYATD